MGLYLDENATATPLTEAAEAAASALLEASNASAPHAQGRRARGALERARRQVAASLNVSPRHLTFCSSATEALHAVILGYLSRGDHVVVSAVEHPAVWGALEAARELLEVSVSVAPVSVCGALNIEEVMGLLTPRTRLVVVMAAQNELGLTYPTRALADRLAERSGPLIPLLCDCVQAWGKVPLSLPDTGATFAVVSGHKIGAPIGSGVLWAREGEPLRPLLRGGSQERGRRAGTEAIAPIIGLGVAAERLSTRLAEMERVRALRDELAERLCAHPSLTLNTLNTLNTLSSLSSAQASPRSQPWVSWREQGELPNTLSLRAKGVAGDLLLQALDLEGYYLSSGSACSSGALSPSPVLKALGLSDEEAGGGLRVSIGPQTSEEGLWRFAERLTTLLDQLTPPLA